MNAVTGALLAAKLNTSTSAVWDSVEQILRVVRTHLDMDVGFVSEFVGEHRVFRHVDAAGQNAPIAVGGSGLLDESYCWRVVSGILPELIPDTAEVPAAMAMPVTKIVPVGAHLSVPILLPDGRLYGTFCCFSHRPDRSLNARDLGVMRAFAEVSGQLIYRELESERERWEKAARIADVLEHDRLSTVYQPIYGLADGRCAGFECLSRFAAAPVRSPDKWFAEAFEAGLGIDLELAAVRRAVAGFAAIPDDCFLCLNVGPETILSERLPDALSGLPPGRLVLEITEHAVIGDYDAVVDALSSLRRGGVRLAVDDAGAGYASFRHILKLKPEIIKLDVSLISGIDADRIRYALAAALVSFAHAADSSVVAEGVETVAELNALVALGADRVQGYLLGRPMPPERAHEALTRRGWRDGRFGTSPAQCRG